MKGVHVIRWSAAAVVMAVAAGGGVVLLQAEASLHGQVAVQRQTIGQLERRITWLEGAAGSQPDWSSIAATVEPSVATIVAGDASGSGWVAHSDATGSDLITNFHVVADAWSAGVSTVQVLQGDHSSTGTIARLDRNDDLAVVHVKERLTVLRTESQRPKLGASVMAVGSPLGLGGTVTLGVVSGFRSLGGSDYVQFSAPISPGNSGGPVIDSHGRVVAIASAKLVGTGVEALSLAIPVQVPCLNLVSCSS